MREFYCEGIKHKIRPGDTLYKLSRCYNVPLSKILEANTGVEIYNLKPGTTVCIPDVGTWQDMITGSCKLNDVYNMWDDNNMDDDREEIAIHKVKEGETLMDVLKMHDMSCEELIELNMKNGIMLKPDMELFVEKEV